ncbi:CDP-alcohol phosphatidyltransferase family protein [Scleromatobacter humisilvae]|uniref:CDP-alcohol phosphatidyltransferase family protein n=1 Tax=Scleromatobacter humisilvae TaxID=2897159 RepID=A0A9X1YIC6_9BURK|nr:CDP-alcohol phosphatidyltransferase family protein [Scleromatobacter humisilvae]MCK9686262.1 CDP-alcohol phosphatidyltransferase family protein [Scleromatobacter humisilvae]
MTLSVYQLKPQFQRLLRPLVQALASARVTPNQLTVATAALMVAYGAALAAWPTSRGLWLGLVAVMPLRMALNALDGLLATHTGRKTRLGAMLNEVCDVVADLALTLPAALIAGVPPMLAVLVACGAAVVEMTGLAALAAGSPRRFDGPMGKSDRAVAYGLVGLLAGCGAPAAWITGVLALVALLLAWTLLNRLRAGAVPPTP